MAFIETRPLQTKSKGILKLRWLTSKLKSQTALTRSETSSLKSRASKLKTHASKLNMRASELERQASELRSQNEEFLASLLTDLDAEEKPERASRRIEVSSEDSARQSHAPLLLPRPQHRESLYGRTAAHLEVNG